jgi:hypothetical protein
VDGICQSDDANVLSILPAVLPPTMIMAQDADRLFWTAPDGVYVAPKAGGSASLLAGTSTTIAGVVAASAYLYFSTPVEAAIRRVAVGGGMTETFTAANEPTQVLADATYLYWRDTATMTVRRKPLDGSADPTIVLAYSEPPSYPALHFAIDSKFLYYAPQYMYGGITRVNKDGTGDPVVLYPQSHHSMVIADDDGLYFTYMGLTPGTAWLSEIPKDATHLSGGLAGLFSSPVTFSLTKSRLYIPSTEGIFALIRSCGPQHKLLTSPRGPFIGDDTALYVIDGDKLRKLPP